MFEPSNYNATRCKSSCLSCITDGFHTLLDEVRGERWEDGNLDMMT